MVKEIVKKKAPAKINLHLRILNKRKDGYHNIETLFVKVGLADDMVIHYRENDAIDLKVQKSNIPTDERNLCYQAAKLFSNYCHDFSGCSITLKKRIPHGAGLGGGSSDAAATLTGLNEMFGSPLSDAKLFQLASKLGADVPFFLRGGLAIGTGKGDVLEYLNIRWKFWVLLLCPDFGISSRWAYSNYKIGLTKEEKNIILKSQFLKSVQLDDFIDFFENNFELLVFSSHPELGIFKKELYNRGAFFASLSGSGSAMYGLYHDYKTANEAKEYFQSSIRSFLVETLYTHSV